MTDGSGELGFAVDAGTTSLSCRLVRRSDGAVLKELSSENPQRVFGADVISRITVSAENPELPLAGALCGGIERLALLTARAAGITPDRIKNAPFTIAGNTVMEHYICGLSPVSLGQSPYLPLSLFGETREGRETGFQFFADSRVYIAPCISGFVGGDVVSGLITLPESDESFLYIDLGTNAETVLCTGGKYYCASAAAGPALEGAGIDCGLPASAPGCVSGFYFSDGRAVIRTFDGRAPAGMCGTALLSLVSHLLRLGFITPDGRINGRAEHPDFSVRDGAVYITGTGLYLSGQDIRAFQLAKGAVAAAYERLMQKAGIGADKLRRVYLAGDMGAFAAPDTLEETGLLGAREAGLAVPVGNASLTGAAMLLFSEAARQHAEKTAKAAVSVNLAGDSGFDELFYTHMAFPG